MPTSSQGRWGLVIARERGLLTSEPYWTAFADGVEAGLAGSTASFYLRQVRGLKEELEVYRAWAAEGFVSGVILVNPLVEDPRPARLAELGLACLHAGTEDPEPGTASIVSSNAATAELVLERLHGLGHRRVARVTGPGELAHTGIRTATFISTAERLGLEVVQVEGDYSHESGSRATEQLLGGDVDQRPTVVIFDNDTMAIAGLERAQSMGLSVPGDVSIVAWDDSSECEMTVPPISAIAIDVRAFGGLIAESVLRVEAGETAFEVPEPEHHWIQRASVADVRPPQR